MISVLEYMEDFDNEELPDYEWKEQLRDACIEYNETYGTDHDPEKTFNRYLVYKTQKHTGFLMDN